MNEIERLKERGNSEFKVSNFRGAIASYTKALLSAGPTTPIEIQRTILANRAQTYLSFGNIHDALRDVDRALSPEYTREDSSKTVTVKCHFRRAKLLCIMARYDEARADYLQLSQIMSELGVQPSGEDRRLEEDINRGANADEGSERRQKDELMRAIDARGFLLRLPNRDTFPLPPPMMLESLGPDFDTDGGTIHFDTNSGRPNPNLPNPLFTPIAIPIYIRAPYFKLPSSTTPFSTRQDTPVSEYETVGFLLDGLFASHAAFYGGPRPEISMVVQHDSDHKSVVLVVTSHGRILVIPRHTKLKDIVAGARWPRLSAESADEVPLFKDLRKEPRGLDERIDGIELTMGWFMEVYVIPKDNLKEFLNKLETGFRDFRIQ